MAEPRRALYGRFVRKQICKSKSVAALIQERGPWAGLLFERLILWGDDDGRFIAEPSIVKADCLPWHSRSERQIAEDLRCMEALGLIVLYEVGGTQYGYFPTWRKHQPAQRSGRYTPSEKPPPPDSPSGGQSDSQAGGQNGVQSDSQSTASSLPTRSAEAEAEAEEEVEAATERVAAAVSQLVSQGVGKRVATKLVEQFGPEAIEVQIGYLRHRRADNPAAMLVESIRGAWQPPRNTGRTTPAPAETFGEGGPSPF